MTAPKKIKDQPAPRISVIGTGYLGATHAACMAELDPDRRRAVRAAYLDGASYADLAAALGVPLNTIRTWLRRSLIRLRECLSR